MIKTKAQNLKSLSHRKLSQVELTFNSNYDLNILLGENSKNLDKLNEMIATNRLNKVQILKMVNLVSLSNDMNDLKDNLKWESYN